MQTSNEFRTDDVPWETTQAEREIPPSNSTSIPHLLRLLTNEVTTLFSKEISLARAEARETVHEARAGIVAMLGGSVVLLAGLIVLLMAAVYGLADRMPLWMAAAIVGGAVTLIGLVMLATGKSKLSAEALKPERTVRELRKDRETMRAAVAGGR